MCNQLGSNAVHPFVENTFRLYNKKTLLYAQPAWTELKISIIEEWLKNWGWRRPLVSIRRRESQILVLLAPNTVRLGSSFLHRTSLFLNTAHLEKSSPHVSVRKSRRSSIKCKAFAKLGAFPQFHTDFMLPILASHVKLIPPDKSVFHLSGFGYIQYTQIYGYKNPRSKSTTWVRKQNVAL